MAGIGRHSLSPQANVNLKKLIEVQKSINKQPMRLPFSKKSIEVIRKLDLNKGFYSP
jgi:hypothetical protein